MTEATERLPNKSCTLPSPPLSFKNGKGKTNKEEKMNMQYEEIEGGVQHTLGFLIS